MRRDGEVAGHVATQVGTFWAPLSFSRRRQWWVWFIVVWPMGIARPPTRTTRRGPWSVKCCRGPSPGKRKTRTVGATPLSGCRRKRATRRSRRSESGRRISDWLDLGSLLIGMSAHEAVADVRHAGERLAASRRARSAADENVAMSPVTRSLPGLALLFMLNFSNRPPRSQEGQAGFSRR